MKQMTGDVHAKTSVFPTSYIYIYIYIHTYIQRDTSIDTCILHVVTHSLTGAEQPKMGRIGGESVRIGFIPPFD